MNENWQSDPENGHKSLLRVILAFAILLLVIIGLYAAGQYLESKGEKDEPRGDLETRFTQAPSVLFNGEQYQQKTHLTTLLVMGIDQYSTSTNNKSSFRNGGQADYLVLLVIDDDSQTITTIQIDRDTMAEVTTLGVLGNVTGTRRTQICLSHGFGDGLEQSCKLTKDAVSKLLLGVDIQYYLAMDLDGIAVFNDAIGGVTVTLEDDFTSLDPDMYKGATVSLKGMQAEYFVRNRMNIGIGTNESRMVRQQVYWQGINQQLSLRLSCDGNADFIGNLFDQLNAYLITDVTRGRLINLVWNKRDYRKSVPIHPAGEYTIGEDGFTEFHTDEDALESLVMDTFFNKVV